MSSLQIVTAALASKQGPQLYVAEAAALGFPVGVLPRYLACDLGNKRALWHTGTDAQGTATYKQIRGKVILQVRGADPERARGADPERAADAGQRGPAIAALPEKLRSHIARSEAARRALAYKILDSDSLALSALRDPQLALIQLGGLSKQVLAELDAAGEDEQEEALNYCVRKFERWLQDWSPSTGSSPVMIVHLGAEFEAVRRLLGELQEAFTPKSNSAQAEGSNQS
jgi:hypothetical protein